MKPYKTNEDPPLSSTTDTLHSCFKSVYSDRYIPLRSSSLNNLLEEEPRHSSYTNLLKQVLSPNKKQLIYKSTPHIEPFQLDSYQEPC